MPTECNTYADIDAAYKCLKKEYGVKDEQLILYGLSVGSGPTVDLASRLPNSRGVVLHSPILSGMRVLYPVKRTYWFDIFKNIDKIGAVNCQVLVIPEVSRNCLDSRLEKSKKSNKPEKSRMSTDHVDRFRRNKGLVW
ncbi:Alpha/beta hydrolase domain-containing protein 17C [Hibiscus syriacus]|uniref:Alpha/beta hydrolase domain-containing protein 17C n=1 Tax=Hibiscus syriacus TaxID=106335 RepID=A0A6A3BZV8_HIBSY|nr:Alpha/beta hydrolase domain-containing protein 17C [Hibiscus syriacus]